MEVSIKCSENLINSSKFLAEKYDMISLRNNGEQMPGIIRKYLGKGVYNVYNVFLCFLMILVGAVFIYTPGDLVVTQILHQKSVISNPIVWVVYGCIFAYYLAATLFPIDKIIGKVYPIFGMILLLSAIGVGIGIFVKGYPLTPLSGENWMGVHPQGLPILPIFFVTVACGIVSGFHSTQATLIARSVTNEREGKFTFYDMMILEGLIAMIWSAAAMGVYNIPGLVAPEQIGSPDVIGIVANDLLGKVGGLIAILGVIVLPITSGDTALRSVRLMIGDALHIDQTKKKNRFTLSACIFVPVAAILVFAKSNAEGFNVLWRYFAWANQTIACFAFAMITVYLLSHKKNYIMSLIPGMFYVFIISAYILNAQIGFRLPMNIAYIGGVVLAIVYAALVIKKGKNTVDGERLA